MSKSAQDVAIDKFSDLIDKAARAKEKAIMSYLAEELIRLLSEFQSTGNDEFFNIALALVEEYHACRQNPECM